MSRRRPRSSVSRRRRAPVVRDAGLLLVLLALVPALWLDVVWRDQPDAPQTVYRDGVPHTDRTGIAMTEYAAGRSFLPRGIYHALSGAWHGTAYDFATLAAAGFNTVHTWERQSLAAVLPAARAAGVQVVYHDPDLAEVQRYHADPALLSWYLDEEPALRFPESEQAALRAAFAGRRTALRSIDPQRPVHIVAAPPGRFAAWDAWAIVGDVAALAIYPVRRDRDPVLAGPRALADSVARAVALNGARKPVWFVAQAFASPALGWRMPTPREYRTMVYAAIVHGATGVIAFAYDSFVTRDGQVLGIAPEPRADPGAIPDYDGRGDAPLLVDDAALATSRALWQAVAAVNGELAALTPALLSPTATLAYRVAVRGLSAVETPVRTLLKRDADGYVLIAVNLGNGALDVRFAFDAAVGAVDRPFADAAAVAADPAGQGWRTRMGAHETQIFRFTPVRDSPQGPRA